MSTVIVSSYSQRGSIQDLMIRNFSSRETIPEQQILRWTLELCKAVFVFHACSPPLAHRDIKVLQCALCVACVRSQMFVRCVCVCQVCVCQVCSRCV